MATMDDLIATISGGMHVSQEGYDLKALQEYLAQTIVLPNLPPGMSPSTSYRPVPPSRAPSMTRKPSSYPSSHVDLPAYGQPIASPMNHHHHTHTHAYAADQPSSPLQRPSTLRRSSSYGFGGVQASASSPYGFESDAFAPLAQQQQSVDPWARMRAAEKTSNPWAGTQWEQAGPSSYQPPHMNQGFGAFGGARYQSPSRGGMFRGRQGPGEDTAEEDDDDMMDEDRASAGMDEEDEEDSVERVMGIGGEEDERAGFGVRGSAWGAPQPGAFGQSGQTFDWERGRRKA
ncbi:hypothetical protein EHS25_006200 [Saitozyma podzolica]|uniref:Uncharacterized protein n=1 Tax=Saitozyma podzolica TaxID=1890683 RepID=A0A427XS00_9TREE|nr:hypothetical protein EHS25_006200 [Saitozyma podzolica]